MYYPNNMIKEEFDKFIEELDMMRNLNKAENNIIGGANKCRILVLKEFAIV